MSVTVQLPEENTTQTVINAKITAALGVIALAAEFSRGCVGMDLVGDATAFLRDLFRDDAEEQR